MSPKTRPNVAPGDLLLQRFHEELVRCRRPFTWKLDHEGLRAYHPEFRYPFCPFTAIHFRRTGIAVRTNYAHEVAEEMGFGPIATKIVEAADSRSGPLFDRLRKDLQI